MTSDPNRGTTLENRQRLFICKCTSMEIKFIFLKIHKSWFADLSQQRSTEGLAISYCWYLGMGQAGRDCLLFAA